VFSFNAACQGNLTHHLLRSQLRGSPKRTLLWAHYPVEDAMSTRKHPNDQATGPGSAEADEDGPSQPDGQPMPEDTVEGEGERLARETERGLDKALNRVPPH
jgi:hypothetical protein